MKSEANDGKLEALQVNEGGAAVFPSTSGSGVGSPSGSVNQSENRCNAKESRTRLLAPLGRPLFSRYYAYADHDRLADARREFDAVRTLLEAEDWRPVGSILPALRTVLGLGVGEPWTFPALFSARETLRAFLDSDRSESRAAGDTSSGDALKREESGSGDPLASLAGSLVSARAWLERIGWSQTGGTQLRDQIDAALALVPPAVRLGQAWVSRVTKSDGPELVADGAGLLDGVQRIPTPDPRRSLLFADALDAAPRIGEAVDEPEGARVVQLSDTLARSLAEAIRLSARPSCPTMADLKRAPGFGEILEAVGAVVRGVHAWKRDADPFGIYGEEFQPAERALGHLEKLVEEAAAARIASPADLARADRLLDSTAAVGSQLEYLRASVREAFKLPANADDADLIETLFEAANNPRFGWSTAIELLEKRCSELDEARTATLRENARLKDELDAARAEVAVDDKIIADLDRILEALPCPVHGPCVPYVLARIAGMQADAPKGVLPALPSCSRVSAAVRQFRDDLEDFGLRPLTETLAALERIERAVREDMAAGRLAASPVEVWVAGRALPDAWAFLGVFRSRAAALAACPDESCFVAPVVLEKAVDALVSVWPGAFYPKAPAPIAATIESTTGDPWVEGVALLEPILEEVDAVRAYYRGIRFEGVVERLEGVYRALLAARAKVDAGRIAVLETALADSVPAIGGVATVVDLVAHLERQSAWSLRTFGPGVRLGVVAHIRKELLEIEAQPTDLEEWIDVALLAFDGAWRAGATPAAIAAKLLEKQGKNERRQWPDWRTAPADAPIEHVRTIGIEPCS